MFRLLKPLGLFSMLMAASIPALAIPTLRITDVGSATTVTVFSGTGNVSYNGVVGGWNINIVSGLTNPAIGSATDPQFSVTSQNRYNGAGTGRLVVEFSETDFSAGTTVGLQLSTSSSTQTPASIFSAARYDSGNNLYGTTTSPTYSQAFNTESVDYNSSPFTGVFSDTRIAAGTFTGGPFSLTTILDIRAATGQAVNLTQNLSTVPEPGFYGLLSVGVAGLFVAIRRKRKA